MLPEKWKINRAYSNKIVDWFKNTYSFRYEYAISLRTQAWLYSEPIDKTELPHSSTEHHEGFVEISFEDFEKYILKKEINYEIY